MLLLVGAQAPLPSGDDIRGMVARQLRLAIMRGGRRLPAITLLLIGGDEFRDDFLIVDRGHTIVGHDVRT